MTGKHPRELFNLEDDLTQRINRDGQDPQIAAELKSKWETIKNSDVTADEVNHGPCPA